MKTSKVFKLAKLRLWNGVSEERLAHQRSHLCLAVDITTAPIKDKKRAKRIVDKLLHPYCTFESWLSREKNIYPFGNLKKLQVTRQAWLDHLIKHYESIGD